MPNTDYRAGDIVDNVPYRGRIIQVVIMFVVERRNEQPQFHVREVGDSRHFLLNREDMP